MKTKQLMKETLSLTRICLKFADDVTVADGDGSVHPVRVGLLFVPATQRTHPISQFVLLPEIMAVPVVLNVSTLHLQSEQAILPAAEKVVCGT
jgi:hypothetical protein